MEHHHDYFFAQRLVDDLRQAGADVHLDAVNEHEHSIVEQGN